MSLVNHKIRTVLFDGQVSSEDQAGQWTQAIRRLDMDKVMEKVLGPYDHTAQWWRIERLEIDLGWVDIGQDDWVERMSQMIEEELNLSGNSIQRQGMFPFSYGQNQIETFSSHGATTGSVDVLVTEECLFWEGLESYLTTGYLPWQFVNTEEWNFSLLWEYLNENRSGTLARLRKIILSHPTALGRLWQLARQTGEGIPGALLMDRSEREFSQSLFQWVSLLDKSWRSPDKRIEFNQLVWKALICFPDSLVERWEQIFRRVKEGSTFNISESSGEERPQAPKEWLEIPIGFSFILDLDGYKELIKAQLQETGHPKNKIEVPAFSEEMGKVEPLVDEEKSLFISNAGICLVNAALIRRYFTQMGWLGVTDFSSNRNREKAVWWIEYLAFGEIKRQEYHLGLNKLLCGLDPADLLEHTRAILTRKEKREADRCLTEILVHWSALRTEKLETLRESFLQRPGRLSQTGDRWQLQVEARAYDILIEKIPWAFSIIKFPWMKTPLFTQWPTRI